VSNFEQTGALWVAYLSDHGRSLTHGHFHSPASSDRGECAVTASHRGSKLSLFVKRSRGDVAMESPTVLCIDDRPHVLELRKATLESHGYCVKMASSGYTAMKMLEETSVAAVLLEYKLEGMDVEAVAFHIKQRFPSLPIILLSAYSEMPERILWLVDEYVMKSELPERLVPVIDRAHKLGPRSDGFRRRDSVA
jgi:CheY-like chemotaxis protein